MRKQAISSCHCCAYTPLPSWKIPRPDNFDARLVRFDANARGLSVPSLLNRSNPYPEGEDPAGGELLQSLEASLFDGQVLGKLLVDVLPFQYGRQSKNAGFATIFTPAFISGQAEITVQAYVPVHGDPPNLYSLPGGNGLERYEATYASVGNKDITALLGLQPGSPGDAWRPSVYQTEHFRPTAFRVDPTDRWPDVPEWIDVPKDESRYPAVPGEIGFGAREGPAKQYIPIWSPGTHKFISLPYEPNTASAIFGNTFWALGGNVLYAQCQTCRDFWTCRFRVQLDDQERLWMPAGGYSAIPGAITSTYSLLASNGADVLTSPGFFFGFAQSGTSPAAVMPVVRLVQAKAETPDTVVATAYARAFDDSDATWAAPLNSLGLLYAPGRSNAAQPGYTSSPLAGISYSGAAGVDGVAIYRDGALVANLSNPTSPRADEWYSQAIGEATEDEGSYLLVGDNTNGYGLSGPMYVVTSVVVDKTPPIGVVKQIGDIYEGDATGLLPEWGYGFQYGNTPEIFRCVQESEPCSGSRGWINDAGGTVQNPATLPEGQYAFRQNGPIRDRAANEMGYLPRLAFNVRKRAGQNAYGPSATIELPENNRGTYAAAESCCHSLLYDDPVLSFTIRFDRPVDKLTVRHFKLERRDAAGGWAAIDLPLSGDPPTALTAPDLTPEERSVLTGNVVITRKSAQEYTLTFPHGASVFSNIEQLPNSIFTLTFDPRLVTGNNAMQVLDDGGQVITDQKCDLATRVMWGRMPEHDKNKNRIDTTALSQSIGGVSSVTKQVPISALDAGGPRERPMQISFRTTANVSLSEGIAKLTEAEPCDGSFVPRCPPHPFIASSGDTANYGFFGLGTSIFPAPAKKVLACEAPSAAQWHSSAICGQSEITSFSATFFTTTGFDESYLDSLQNRITNVIGSGLNVRHYINTLTSQAAPYIVIPWVTPRPVDELAGFPLPASMTFAASLSGYSCQQNVWAIPPGGNYQGWLTASRAVDSYPALNTAFLHRLSIGISGHRTQVFNDSGYLEHIYPPGSTGASGGWMGGAYLDYSQTDYNWTPWSLGSFALSPNQEAALASGEAVELLLTQRASTDTFYLAIRQANINAPRDVYVFAYPEPDPKDDPNFSAAVKWIFFLGSSGVNGIRWTERLYVRLQAS